MSVHWTNQAIDHLLAIHDFAAQNSKVYADRLVDRLTRRPVSGIPVQEW